jgi:hypothetical protein
MEEKNEIRVFSCRGSEYLDIFRQVLLAPHLAFAGIKKLELLHIQPGAKVVLRRVERGGEEEAGHELPWCQFWGRCDDLKFSNPIRESGEHFHELSFTASPFQLVKHFHQCTCCEEIVASALICLPQHLGKDLLSAMQASDPLLRRLRIALFLQSLCGELLVRKFDDMDAVGQGDFQNDFLADC